MGLAVKGNRSLRRKKTPTHSAICHGHFLATVATAIAWCIIAVMKKPCLLGISCLIISSVMTGVTLSRDIEMEIAFPLQVGNCSPVKRVVEVVSILVTVFVYNSGVFYTLRPSAICLVIYSISTCRSHYNNPLAIMLTHLAIIYVFRRLGATSMTHQTSCITYCTDVV